MYTYKYTSHNEDTILRQSMIDQVEQGGPKYNYVTIKDNYKWL